MRLQYRTQRRNGGTAIDLFDGDVMVKTIAVGLTHTVAESMAYYLNDAFGRGYAAGYTDGQQTEQQGGGL